MKCSNRWTRRAGAAFAAAMLATTGLAIAGGNAGAIPAGGLDVTVTSGVQPTIGLGSTGQPGGTLRIAPTVATQTFTTGDQIRVFLDDSDGADANCLTATDFVTFDAVPTVTNSGAGAKATFTASIEESSPGLCSTFPGTFNDVLLITITGSGSGVFDVTDVTLNNGPTTALGFISHSVVSAPATGITYVPGAPPASGIAYITSLVLTANDPPLGAVLGTPGFQSGSPIIITEQTLTAADGLTLCLTLGGGNTFDTLAPLPTVTVSGVGTLDTAGAVTVAAGSISFPVVAGAPTAESTFTVSGFRTTKTSTGPDFVTLGTGACPGAPVSLPTTISTVIGLTRFSGGTRYDTAALAFSDWGCTTDAVITTGENYPDALASTYLADFFGTPILLTQPNSIPGSTLNALRTGGSDMVRIIGGTDAISQAVEDQLKATPNYDCGGAIELNGLAVPINLSVVRIGGATRYDTMKNVVEYPGYAAAGTADYDGTLTDPDGTTCAPLKTAVIARGDNFPDALVAGQFAVGSDIGCGSGSYPVILTPGTALGSQASAVLANLGIQQVIVAGGTAAVSAAVETSIQGLGITTRRLAGPTRQDTAVALATFKAQFFGAHADSVLVVRGDDFADALSSPVWFGHNANMVLTESPTSLGAPTAAYLATVDNIFPLNGPPVLDPFDDLTIFGGTVAVGPTVLQAILDNLSIVEAPE